MGQWVAALFGYGLVLKPNLTRLIAAIFSMITISDFVHNLDSAAYSLSARAKPEE